MKKINLMNMLILAVFFLLNSEIMAQDINWQGGSTVFFNDDIAGTQEVFGTLTLAAANYSFDISTSGGIQNPSIDTKLFINNQVISQTSGNFDHSGDQNTFKLEISRNNLGNVDPCEEITVTINFKNIFLSLVGSSTYTIKVKESLRLNHQGILNDPFNGYRRNIYSHLIGCGNVNIKTNGICSNDIPPIIMMVTEASYNPITLDLTPIPSTEVKRELTNIEKQDLIGIGFEFISFSNSNQSITLLAGRYYLVTLVNVRNSGWIPTYKYFQIKAGTHDFAMKDFEGDYGVEPSDKLIDGVFKSPDIWNNIPNRGVNNHHHNPDYVTPPFTQGNLMRFNLKNIGCANTASENKHNLRLFWTRARTDELWDEHWRFSPVNRVQSAIQNNGMITAGSEITIGGATAANPYSANSQPVVLQNIPANSPFDYLYYESAIGTQVEWFPPNPTDFDVTNGSMSNAGNRPVICFLAVLNDKINSNDPLTWEPTIGNPSLPTIPIYPFVKNSNNVVTRNSILITDDPDQLVDRGGGDWDYGWSTVWVNNNQPTTRDVTLCVDLEDVGLSNDFSNYGFIEIGITEGLWSSWLSSGMNEENITVISPTLFRLNSTHGCIENVPVLSGSEEQIGVRFVFEGDAILPDSMENFDYVLSAVYDENYQGSSCVFEVNVPTNSPLINLNKRNITHKKYDLPIFDLIIYPNPAKGLFLMSAMLPEQSIYSIIITDVQGRLIEKVKGTNKAKYFTHSFDMSEKRVGVYYLTLRSGEIVSTKKIVLVD